MKEKPLACLAHGARDVAALREALRPIILARRPRWAECAGCHELCHPDCFDPIYGGLCGFCGAARLEALFRRLANARSLTGKKTAILALERFARGER
jgi:hypothetical protein